MSRQSPVVYGGGRGGVMVVPPLAPTTSVRRISSSTLAPITAQ